MILRGHWFIPLKNLQNIRSGFFRNSEISHQLYFSKYKEIGHRCQGSESINCTYLYFNIITLKFKLNHLDCLLPVVWIGDIIKYLKWLQKTTKWLL